MAAAGVTGRPNRRNAGRRLWVESCQNELAKAAVGPGYPDQRQITRALRTLTDRSASGGIGRNAAAQVNCRIRPLLGHSGRWPCGYELSRSCF